MRPKKVDLGLTLMAALRERYGLLDDDAAGVLTDEMFVRGNKQRTTVEVVGAKSVNLHQRYATRFIITKIQIFEILIIRFKPVRVKRRDWSLITGRGGGGRALGYKTGGEASEVLPLQKRGGEENSFSHAEGGTQRVLR